MLRSCTDRPTTSRRGSTAASVWLRVIVCSAFNPSLGMRVAR